MKNARIVLAGLSSVLVFSMAFAASPPSVNAEQMDLDADILAKIGKEKSKGSTIADGMMQGRDSSGGAGASGSKSGCGNVNINSNTAPKSNSGIKEMFGKQSTTIVTGPVINMANCK